VGEYKIVKYKTQAAGYGGDILVFKEDRTSVWAVHRVYTRNPKQRRLERLASGDPNQRRSITDGCINIMPDVYQKLVDCCAGQTMVVKP